MNSIPKNEIEELPEAIQALLKQLVEAAQGAFQEDLRSVVLFGSGAEGRLRPSSDLNLLIVLKRFEQGRVDSFREPLRLARVAARASVMFLLESELAEASEAFAVKFDDIARRHRVLFGDDVVGRIAPGRAARKARLRQVLMNLMLRLRERYATVSLREEQLAVVIAEAAGPLRAAASTLCELEGQGAPSPKEALEKVAGTLEGSEWPRTLEAITEARRSGALPAGAAPGVLFRLIQLCEAMRLRAERLA